MNRSNYTILFFTALKLFTHLFTNTQYALHRDEYLYFDQGNHLAWGFMEVPPMTPFLGMLAGWLGGSVFAIRLLPAIAGTITIFLLGHLVKDLGGKAWAIGIACTAFLISPAYLGSNSLFQPVSFNQFCWFLMAFFLIKAIRKEAHRYWYILGIVAGLGFLTKYSIVFYAFDLFLGLLLTKERKWLGKPYPYIALAIALLLALPHLFWQYEQGFPVVRHMQELRETQLVHVSASHFLLSQLQFHFAAALVWITGLVALFVHAPFKPYRFLGIAFLACLAVILFFSGKAYYTIGAFTVLFAFGGLALAQWLKKTAYQIALLAVMVFANSGVAPYFLPLLPVEQMAAYCQFMVDTYGLEAPLRWEDGQYHKLPQDIADMHGWEEMVQKVSKIYHTLPEDKKATCQLFGGSYGHAGALNYFRDKYQLPEAYSFNSSYMLWAPEQVSFDNQIMVDDQFYTTSSWFDQIQLVDSISHPYAREKGYIYYRSEPKVDIQITWTEVLEQVRAGE
ncbi:MAG: glycosyltransferase family 39 protein [Bacteroidota bacterium]